MAAKLDLDPYYKVKVYNKSVHIGEVSTAAGVLPQTIRFYERRGLLAPPQRGSNGYREYDASILSRLSFIRGGQAAGLTLTQIAGVLDLRRDGAVPCAHVQSLLLAKLEDIRARQRELELLGAELEGLIIRSERLDPADCTDMAICHIIGIPDHRSSMA